MHTTPPGCIYSWISGFDLARTDGQWKIHFWTSKISRKFWNVPKFLKVSMKVWRYEIFFICPIAIAQQGTDYEITCVLLSVCLSVRLTVRAVAVVIRFWWNFAQRFGARKAVAAGRDPAAAFLNSKSRDCWRPNPGISGLKNCLLNNNFGDKNYPFCY